MTMSGQRNFNLDYRPDTYWVDEQRPTNVKGELRRRYIKSAMEKGETENLPESLLKASLSEEDRILAGRIHPSLMGGEYLPDLEEDQVEIARVSLNSVMNDVFLICASRDKAGEIIYDIADEYSSKFDFTAPWGRTEPLTMGELIESIDSAAEYEAEDCDEDGGFNGRCNYRGLVAHWFCDCLNAPKFVKVSSEFYPELVAYYEDQIAEWVREVQGEDQ